VGYILILVNNTFGILLTVKAGKGDGSIKMMRVDLNGKGLDFFSEKYNKKFKLQLYMTLIAKDDKDGKLEFTSGIYINIKGKGERL